jgi:flagellar assembly protein FliH
MDPLIRSAELAPARTRLSTQAQALAPARGPHREDAASTQARLREEIERHVRAELAAEARAAAEAERERARVRGHAEGLAEGRSAALLDAAQARTEHQAEVARALQALGAAHAAALEAFEAAVGHVAFAAVCRLVGRHAGTALFTQGLVDQACAPVRAASAATVRLHPRDIEALGELRTGDGITVGSMVLKLQPDESLALGGCLVETELGDVQGDLASQLRRLHAVLNGADPDGGGDGEGPADARA